MDELTPRALAVRVDGQRHLLPLDRLEAVLVTPSVTRVPGTPAILAGAVNHQGVIYPAVHLGEPGAARRHAVLVRSQRHGTFALLCDWADDLVALDDGPLVDVDAVAERVLAAYAGVEQRLPDAVAPRAVIRLRKRRT